MTLPAQLKKLEGAGIAKGVELLKNGDLIAGMNGLAQRSPLPPHLAGNGIEKLVEGDLHLPPDFFPGGGVVVLWLEGDFCLDRNAGAVGFIALHLDA